MRFNYHGAVSLNFTQCKILEINQQMCRSGHDVTINTVIDGMLDSIIGFSFIKSAIVSDLL